jgi:hypothetical protein
MGLQATPETSNGVMGAIRGVLNIFSDINKAGGVNENSNPMPQDEYESNLTEIECIELIGQWKRTYATYYGDIEKSQAMAFEYWIGKQRSDNPAVGTNEIVDNLIFEAIETFLPIATRSNPDPLVQADPSDIGQQIAHDIKGALVDWADVTKLRRKLARMTRHWTIYRIGVLKVSWDLHTKTIKLDVINPKRMIFDKDGYIDEGGNFVGEYLGEKKKLSAQKLIEMFPRKKQDILDKAKQKLGTKLEFFEWWYKGEDVFYTLEDTVLGKYKNPNWNYNGKEQSKDPMTGEMVTDEIQGTNHLKVRTDPYIFLNIFSTGLQPHDETSLILQNIPMQDNVNKLHRQIDKNIDSMNNGMVVSGKAFTEDQASNAASALRRGVAIRVVARFAAEGLPADVFQQLNDSRNEIRNIFGTAGSTSQGVESQDTVRGKIMVNQMDSSRIGGGVTECIEQVADTLYNKVVQFMFVYYDEEHFVTTAGAVSGMELIALKNANFPLLKTLSVTVKEGSLVPKDPLTQRNQAIDMWSSNSIDPLSYFKALDVPDPVQSTNQLMLWQMYQKGQIQPQMYLPSFKMAGDAQMGQVPGQPMPQTQPGTGGPAVSPPLDGGTINPQQPPVTQETLGQESHQLISSVPIK